MSSGLSLVIISCGTKKRDKKTHKFHQNQLAQKPVVGAKTTNKTCMSKEENITL